MKHDLQIIWLLILLLFVLFYLILGETRLKREEWSWKSKIYSITDSPVDDNPDVEVAPVWNLNSKLLDVLSSKVLPLEKNFSSESAAFSPEPCISWGLKKEPVVGDGSACE